jgi:hypothetical protein
MPSSQKLQLWLKPNCTWMFIGRSSRTIQGTFLLSLVPIRPVVSEKKLEMWKVYRRQTMNVHWTVFYNLKVFCSDMKFKMATTAGLNLTLDPMGKMFQNAKTDDGRQVMAIVHLDLWWKILMLFTEAYIKTNLVKLIFKTFTIENSKKKGHVPWMDLYKVSVFRSSQIFNMAARAKNMLWLAEISKIFFSETNELTESIY